MENITVPKEKLLTTIRENHAEHRNQFLAAQDKYRERVIAELDVRLEAARTGGRIDLGFALPEPVDYSDSYNTAIQMLEWETAEEIVLSEQDFQRFVLNKWEWARAFAANSLGYL